jgi:hypothetical protein
LPELIRDDRDWRMLRKELGMDCSRPAQAVWSCGSRTFVDFQEVKKIVQRDRELKRFQYILLQDDPDFLIWVVTTPVLTVAAWAEEQ